MAENMTKLFNKAKVPSMLLFVPLILVVSSIFVSSVVIEIGYRVYISNKLIIMTPDCVSATKINQFFLMNLFCTAKQEIN